MNLLSSAYQSAEDYYNQLPSNSGNCLITSFVSPFVWRTVINQDPKIGLLAGTLSATATAIYILICPVFRDLADANNQLTVNQEFCRAGLAFIGSAFVFTTLIPLNGSFPRINLYKEIFGSMLIHCFGIWVGYTSLDARKANWLLSTISSQDLF